MNTRICIFTFMNGGIKGVIFDAKGRLESQDVFVYELPSDQFLLPIPGLIHAIRVYFDVCRVSNPYCLFVLDQSWINIILSTAAYSGLHHQIISYQRGSAFYSDTISQSLLLQLRLLAYGVSGYAASPVSLFFLISLCKEREFKHCNMSGQGLLFEDFYSLVACSKVDNFFNIEKNIDQDAYHFCILMHIIKRLWRWDE